MACEYSPSYESDHTYHTGTAVVHTEVSVAVCMTRVKGGHQYGDLREHRAKSRNGRVVSLSPPQVSALNGSEFLRTRTLRALIETTVARTQKHKSASGNDNEQPPYLSLLFLGVLEICQDSSLFDDLKSLLRDRVISTTGDGGRDPEPPRSRKRARKEEMCIQGERLQFTYRYRKTCPR